jgi:hypothetical protein
VLLLLDWLLEMLEELRLVGVSLLLERLDQLRVLLWLVTELWLVLETLVPLRVLETLETSLRSYVDVLEVLWLEELSVE